MAITILIDSKKDFNYNITIGRKSSWHSQLDFISIVKEFRDNKEIYFAVYIKGFFRKNK